MEYFDQIPSVNRVERENIVEMDKMAKEMNANLCIGVWGSYA